jgi:hypothetical protein
MGSRVFRLFPPLPTPYSLLNSVGIGNNADRHGKLKQPVESFLEPSVEFLCTIDAISLYSAGCCLFCTSQDPLTKLLYGSFSRSRRDRALN